MNPERREQLVREFEAKHPCPITNCSYLMHMCWLAKRDGWLLAHSDSEMSKDAELFAYVLNEQDIERPPNSPHIALVDYTGEINIVQGDEAKQHIRAAIKEDTDGR